ncbi:uncharacterized protein B0H18DRAFT_1070006 [Fomitopsis serialis]|uniref:uncharacterized protein n=1 Tax=Fomitopsis serialis TaxID=139415 RepID=UPI00200746A3|nr:uncharacterized protein B0H18DRAFT_1070006 [Neoantrodia serialis]KAH9910395.1 hypothetical protein B0H18DRAFT_1070006 [Neoantrodia serialis]
MLSLSLNVSGWEISLCFPGTDLVATCKLAPFNMAMINRTDTTTHGCGIRHALRYLTSRKTRSPTPNNAPLEYSMSQRGDLSEESEAGTSGTQYSARSSSTLDYHSDFKHSSTHNAWAPVLLVGLS